MSTEQDLAAMATIMVAARHASEDVGELIAASLQDAATQLGDAEMLVRGRTGSWEAEIVRRMAEAGGKGNQKRIHELGKLFVTLADGDGGDQLSQAMGEAVNALGGLNEFAGGSQWYWDITNIGRQYSDFWNV